LCYRGSSQQEQWQTENQPFIANCGTFVSSQKEVLAFMCGAGDVGILVSDLNHFLRIQNGMAGPSITSIEEMRICWRCDAHKKNIFIKQ
jgi:hypothetical protein